MLLELKDITKSFSGVDGDVEVLRGVSLGLDAGQTLALTGESGSGKSTILHISAGLEVPELLTQQIYVKLYFYHFHSHQLKLKSDPHLVQVKRRAELPRLHLLQKRTSLYLLIRAAIMRLHLDGYSSVSIGHKVGNLPKKCSLILDYLSGF